MVRAAQSLLSSLSSLYTESLEVDSPRLLVGAIQEHRLLLIFCSSVLRKEQRQKGMGSESTPYYLEIKTSRRPI